MPSRTPAKSSAQCFWPGWLPLPGVNVTLTGEVTGKMTAVSSANGNYRFLKLAPGNYDLSYELEGFKNVDRQSIRVNVGASLTLNVINGSRHGAGDIWWSARLP